MVDSPVNPSTKAKVLVVDDEALIRMNMTDMLEELGYSTLEAGNAEDALALLAGDPDIDVLIADLQLPGASGAELVCRARELRPGLKLLVATGHAADHYASRAEFAGVTFLGKPFDFSELRRALETA